MTDMPDEKIVSEMLMAFVDGRIWPEKTSIYGFGPDEVRGMQNVLALLTDKGYTRSDLSSAREGDADFAWIEEQLKICEKNLAHVPPSTRKAIESFVINSSAALRPAPIEGELLEALKEAVKTCKCRGTGVWTTSCSQCGDSTWDHVCDDEDVACDREWCVKARKAITSAAEEKP